MKKNNLSDVKKANRQLVYECIWSHKSVTMTDLAYVCDTPEPSNNNQSGPGNDSG